MQAGVLDIFDGFPTWITRETLMAFFWLSVMLPLSLLEKMNSLRFSSFFGIASIFFLVFATTLHSLTSLRNEGWEAYVSSSSSSSTDGKGIHMFPTDFASAIKSLPIIMFAFTCQVNVFAIYDDLAEPSPRRMDVVSTGAVSTCFLAYLLMGTFGYMDFGQRTLGNVLLNYCVEKSRDPLMISAFVCIVVTIVMAFPLNIFPCRYTLEVALDRCGGGSDVNKNNKGGSSSSSSSSSYEEDGPEQQQQKKMLLRRRQGDGSLSQADSEAQRLEEEESSPLTPLLPGGSPHPFSSGAAAPSSKSRFRHFVLTLLISGSSLLVALVVPNISVVFELMGGTASSFVCFVMPALFGIRLDLGEGRGKLFNGGMWALAVGGAAIGVLSTGVTVYGMFIPEAKKAPVC